MLCPFAHPAACCCAKFETGQTFEPTTPNIFFIPWSPKRNNVGSVHSSSNIAHYTWSTWRLQGLMGCILPTMHCRSQHCRELSHHFAHHCQPGRNNSEHCWQHCWPNFARSFNCKIYWTYRKGLIWDHKTIKITLRENLYVECLDC